MSKPIKLIPRATTQGTWRLNIPPKLSSNGKRQQLFFKTKGAAMAEATKLKTAREEFGNQAKSLSPSMADNATESMNILRPFGITLVDAARRVAAWEMASMSSATMEIATEAFTKAKNGKSDKQKSAIKHAVAHLNKDFAGRVLRGITGEEVAAAVAERVSGPSAYNSKLRLLTTFWRWCAQKPREWCEGDVLAHIERREVIAGRITPLTEKQARATLAAAEAHFPDMVIPIATALFAGLRQAEVQRLQKCDFQEDGIHVPAENDKKNNRRRFIAYPAPLMAWLKAYPLTNTVIHSNYAKRYDAVRRVAGFSVWSDEVTKLNVIPPFTEKPPAKAPKWPVNAFRRTAASTVVALGKPLNELIFEHGHTDGVDTLRRHYIGALSKTEAEKIWMIGPKGGTIPLSKP